MTVLSFPDFADEVLRHVLVGAAPHPGPTDDFYRDLGWDSLQVFEVLVAAEDLAGVEPPDEPPSFTTMQGAYDYYVSLGTPRPHGR
jgi:acyl carrier protein